MTQSILKSILFWIKVFYKILVLYFLLVIDAFAPAQEAITTDKPFSLNPTLHSFDRRRIKKVTALVYYVMVKIVALILLFFFCDATQRRGCYWRSVHREDHQRHGVLQREADYLRSQ